jgi:hypothetical protein
MSILIIQKVIFGIQKDGTNNNHLKTHQQSKNEHDEYIHCK